MTTNIYNFYSPEGEYPGGPYWQLLQIPNDQLKTSYSLPTLLKLLPHIQNDSLKTQLKAKLLSAIDLTTLSSNSSLNLECFSLEEIESFFETALNQILNNSPIPVLFLAIKDSLIQIQRIGNVNWQSTGIIELFNLVDTLSSKYIPDMSKALSTLIINIKDSNTRDFFLKRYSNNLSQEYLSLIKISSNPNYIKEKSKQFSDIRIGIDPRIILGAEIELNHRIFGSSGFNISSQKDIGFYHSTTDVTVPNGSEFVSPKFHDTPEELSIFCATLDTLKELGYESYDNNVSGQINIGIDYLDTTESLLQFVELFCNCEELLFHICNPEGAIMRQPIYNNSRFKAISGKIGTQIISENITRSEVIEMLSPNTNSSLPGLIHKKNTICLRDRNRFEIRISNGSEDYKVWIDNIRLFAKMFEAAKTLANVIAGIDTSESSLHRLELKESLKDESSSLEEKLFLLMDILFDDEQIKSIYVNRFYSLEAKILRTGTRQYKPVDLISDSGFGPVDFQRLYFSEITRSPDGTLTLPTTTHNSHRSTDISSYCH